MPVAVKSSPVLLESGQSLSMEIAWRRIGQGPLKVLLLHALTGGVHPDGPKGWWGPLFAEDAPLAADRVTVWAPNLPGSCYGSTGPAQDEPFPPLTPRDMAEGLAAWIEAEDLRFDAVAGGSLGGMVALELALRVPERVGALGVIGTGGRSDAWLLGHNHVQRRILQEPALPDDRAVALARHAAMLTFRTAKSLNGRFGGEDIRPWLDHHGAALADRFTRASYLALLAAWDAHDLGRGRGGLEAALRNLHCPLHVLGIDSDQLFVPDLILELAEAALAAGADVRLDWLRTPHGHDAFLMEWAQVAVWLDGLLEERGA
ncbi:alpha/beta fold hydrolase [Geothrix sp. 21YS21S-4]|uniref:alpha/beta fold hydrolase n=1 Tax=Geothrix sp. 21YS21S-4 TaxID=3068889 RepID=UPI0027B93656|nr:alpha/beta fold hydrolase [Geothrix sp. 21YS21S-4]